MPRSLVSAACLVAAMACASAAMAAPAPDAAPDPHATNRAAKRHPRQVWHGYGFLPGYRTPERIDWDNARARGVQWWYGSPRWYHGQWNHGGFGPCYTETPIGEIWNCGK